MYYKGLQKLATELRGNENIYLGIRPYGFHSGNMLPFVIYPYLLCAELKKLGKTPKFNFYIFLNDWEQDKLDGPNPITYPYNVYPANTTFQYVYVKNGSKTNIVDKWEPVIVKGVKTITSYFKQTKVLAVRNSHMKRNKFMKRYLLETLKNPDEIASILRERTKRTVLEDPLSYVLAVCPKCLLVRGQTTLLSNNKIVHICKSCDMITKGEYEDFDYWFYHKPLAIPRLEAYRIDLCITGGDHFTEGDFHTRQDLIRLFNAKIKPFKVLYTPVVLGYNNERMGKSKKNDVAISFQELLKIVKKNIGSDTIEIYEKP